MPITIKKPSATEITSLYNLLLESNNAADNPIPAARMEEILQPLDAIKAISLENLSGEELISAQQNIVNLKYQFFVSIFNDFYPVCLNDFYPVCVEHGVKIFKTLYNKSELTEFRPNLTAEDRYRGSLLARIIYAGYVHWDENEDPSTLQMELTMTAIQYDHIFYALFVLKNYCYLEINNLRLYMDNIFPSINTYKATNEIHRQVLQFGYFSRKIFVEERPPQHPILVAGKRYDLLPFISKLELLNEPETSIYIVKGQNGSMVDLRKIKFDYNYASELRKVLRRDNGFKYLFDVAYGHGVIGLRSGYFNKSILFSLRLLFMFVAPVQVGFLTLHNILLTKSNWYYNLILPRVLEPFKKFIVAPGDNLTTILKKQASIISINVLPNAKTLPNSILKYLALTTGIPIIITSPVFIYVALTKEKADLKNISSDPEYYNSLGYKRKHISKTLTICFDKLAKENNDNKYKLTTEVEDIERENPIMERIVDCLLEKPKKLEYKLN